MNQSFKNFKDLVSGAMNFLVEELKYSVKTVYAYKVVWNSIWKFMTEEGISEYNSSVGGKFLDFKHKNLNPLDITYKDRIHINGVRALTEFYVTGKISFPVRVEKKSFVFNGSIGEFISSFLKYKVEENGLSAIRLRYYQNQLSFFLDYCNKNNLSSIQNLDLPFLLGYLQQLDTKPKQTAYLSISSIRGFLKYLYEHKFIFHDLSKKLPKFKKVNQPNLPSVYSKEEIEKLILSVDRSSPIGKRNYAIILIAARLGLRASDISNLKFENIFWEKSTIELNQVKTGKKLILPLMPDIGNAIVEYLKFGRPNSDEPYVFLKERPPYTHFETNVVTHLVQRAFKKAGIDTNGKRFGPHSLRHSLGFRMLAENTTIHVISEVFGHESTESTKFYLRVDLNSMRNCMLDVPLVANKFYEQKGFLL